LRLEAQQLLELLEDPLKAGEDNVLVQLGEIFRNTDAYDPLPEAFEPVDVNMHIYQRVWAQAAELRRSGELLHRAAAIQCPVTVIHGDFDPHPWQGVKEPLEKVLPSFEFIRLKNCGHKPWVERQAADMFYKEVQKLFMLNNW
jgi:pimeloyl-ACP methyl ester carboxylesterase